MESSPNSAREERSRSDRARKREDPGPLILTALITLIVVVILHSWSSEPHRFFGRPDWVDSPVPLVMSGGDPYIRALMRTISAAESNTADPYHLLYGGQQIQDLSRHPDECVTIVTGPNFGNCTTAAGRYQFLSTTWLDKAEKYHPQPPGWYEFWSDYDFSPQYQDEVVYAWLVDEAAWGADLSLLLQEGRLDTVLEMLSGTWTSLGYGIETNSMSAYLPQIYADMLAEELTQ